MQDGTLEDNIPPSSIECADEKSHSDTRGTYLLDDEEIFALKDHPRVEYCHIDYQSYPALMLLNQVNYTQLHNIRKDLKKT